MLLLPYRSHATHAFNSALGKKIKDLFPKYSPKKNPWKAFAVNVVSGALAGAGSLSLVYPLDYVSARMILCTNADGSPRYASVIEVVRDVVRTPGDVLNLYEGYAAAVAGIVPFRAISLLVTPWIRDKGLTGSLAAS